MRTYIVGLSDGTEEYVEAPSIKDARLEYSLVEDDHENLPVRQITYSCEGSVRGDCGHHHNTIMTALKCADRDGKLCSELGGGAYSDRRRIIRHDGDDLDLVFLERLQ